MENSVDLDQLLLQKPADLDLRCFPKKRVHPSVFVCVDASVNHVGTFLKLNQG